LVIVWVGKKLPHAYALPLICLFVGNVPRTSGLCVLVAAREQAFAELNCYYPHFADITNNYYARAHPNEANQAYAKMILNGASKKLQFY
jgi:hypothetical protein